MNLEGRDSASSQVVRIDNPAVADRAPTMAWGSDAIAEALRRLSIPFIALTPGASFRGLHDSIVNYLGNERPAILVCLHEEHAVALAHGFAKVTGAPMAVAIHSNVGLMHASMAIYNAFCDRAPVLLLGAQGPMDAEQRRPWIDWIHTNADPGALVRHYTKWDDQPASPEAALNSIARANLVARTYPFGPTFVSLDVAIQEAQLEGAPQFFDTARMQPPSAPGPSPEQVVRVASLLAESPRTVLLVGRVGPSPEAWDARIALARAIGAQVLTDTKLRSAFPTRDPSHASVPGEQLTASGLAALRAATAVLSLDWVDLEGTLRLAFDGPAPVPVVHCSMDHVLHNGWSKDHFGLAEVDLLIAAHPDALVGQLLGHGLKSDSATDYEPTALLTPSDEPATGNIITLRVLARELGRAVEGHHPSLLRLPLRWDGRDLDLRGPLDYIGYDGGAGIGSGPGIAVGAALALIGTDRLPVALIGDGDFLMGSAALWTAAHHRIPLLTIVANNRAFHNDEVHQERVAIARSRPVENKWIGQHLRGPDVDIAGVARGLGLAGYGPVTAAGELANILGRAVRDVQRGEAVVVDVRIESDV